MPRWSAYQRARAAGSRARKNRPPMPVTRSIAPPVWVAGRGEDAPGGHALGHSTTLHPAGRDSTQADVTVDLSYEDDTRRDTADGWEPTHNRPSQVRGPPAPPCNTSESG